MLVFGTPANLAALRMAARATFVVGSAEPPAVKIQSETGKNESLVREMYTGLQPYCPKNAVIVP